MEQHARGYAGPHYVTWQDSNAVHCRCGGVYASRADFDAHIYRAPDAPKPEPQRRAMYNPYTEGPLRITAEAVRAVRLGCLAAKTEAERRAAATTSPGARQTFLSAAQRFGALAEELARAVDHPEDVQVGDCLCVARREELARNIEASR